MSNDNFVSLAYICDVLHISVATARNWIKLNKLTPQIFKNGKPYFSQDYCNELLQKIVTNENNNLKSRRNKSFLSGGVLYDSYLSKDSSNLLIAQNLYKYMTNRISNMSDDELEQVICYYAKELLSQVFGASNSDCDFLYKSLKYSDNIVQTYPELKNYKFIYNSDEDILGFLYMSLKNISDRKNKGAYYTPNTVVKRLIESVFKNYAGGTIVDPCCGSGNFILHLPQNIKPANIYAGDIDELSIKIARVNFALKYKITDKNFLYNHIKISDFLRESQHIKYDYIIGNPPWAFNFDSKYKKFLRNNFLSAKGNNIESYDVITEHSLNKLNKEGTVAFVLPEAILNVKCHRDIRNFILKKGSIKYLDYLGDIFPGVQCPSIILQIKCVSHFSTKGMHVKTSDKDFIIKFDRKISCDFFNFKCDDSEYELLEKIENIPNKVYLKDNALFALGIVTGDNLKYISKERKSNNEKVLKGADIEKFRINKCGNYIVYKPDNFQQCAKTEIYRAKEKLVYKFISESPVFAYDDEQTLTLNSCNILIPKIDGLNIKYVMAILNSSVIQFYFKKKFNSVKVLRSHIEQIPIPFVGMDIQRPLINMVDKYLKTNSKSEKILEQIDLYCRKLYNFDEVAGE